MLSLGPRLLALEDEPLPKDGKITLDQARGQDESLLTSVTPGKLPFEKPTPSQNGALEGVGKPLSFPLNRLVLPCGGVALGLGPLQWYRRSGPQPSAPNLFFGTGNFQNL